MSSIGDEHRRRTTPPQPSKRPLCPAGVTRTCSVFLRVVALVLVLGNEATQDTLVVTRNGRPQAILRPYPDEAALRRYWEERERALAQLAQVTVDSADYVSEDRGGQ